MAKKASSKLSSIDYSKRGKGVSRREYAASQLGGKLDYKTGKISVPAKQTKKTYSQPYTPSLSGDDADMGYIGTPEYQQYLNENNGKAMPQAEYDTKNLAYNQSRGKGISVSTQREKAKEVYNTRSLGDSVRNFLNKTGIVHGAAASGTPHPTASNQQGTGRGIQELNEKLGWGGASLSKHIEDLLGGSLNLTERLHLNSFLRDDPLSGTAENPAINVNEIGTPAEIRAWGGDEAYRNRPYDITGAGTTRVRETTPITYDTGNNNNNNQRTSTRVSNPILGGTQSSLISALQGGSPQSAPSNQSGQSIDKTQRRFLGNGLLSKGTYGNGSGDYGMEGTFGDNQMSEEDNLLNTLLGIPTAKAAEMQTNLFNQPNTDSLGRPYTGYSAQNGGMSTRYGVDTPPTFTPKNTLNEDYESGATGGYKPQATGGSGSGGVAQQYSQQGENPQEKYYKEAIKNAKKVMKETIKALEKEYKESEATGTAALNKQKREDLQAQSARFSFGLNQDPNSEQAIQYAQRTSNDYAGQLSDFLKKLASSKAQDISAAKQSYYDKQSTAQEKLAELMYNLQIEQEKNSKKGSGTLKNGSYTIIPGPNGENKYVYNNGSQYVPITADQYMAGKYGVGIGSYGGSQDNIEEMDEEELRSIAGY
jgi:hypothetical protein